MGKPPQGAKLCGPATGRLAKAQVWGHAEVCGNALVTGNRTSKGYAVLDGYEAT